MLGRIPVYVQILAAAVAGIGVGLIAGPSIQPIGQLGSLLLQAIKMLAGPLIFVAILDAVLRTQLTWKSARRFGVFLALNATASVLIALFVATVFRPGDWMKGLGAGGMQNPAGVDPSVAFQASALSLEKILKNLLPASLIEPLASNSITGIAIVALLLGLALRGAAQIPEAQAGVSVIADIAHALLKATEKGMSWIIRWVPLAVFAVLARTVGEKGLAPLTGLAAYVIAILLALLLHIGIVYQGWIRIFSRMPLREFWRKARDPVAFAMGASSSLATLPVTLKALDHDFKVGKTSSRLVACVGTNLNNDGILLYEALAMLIVAQAYGIDLSYSQQLLAVGTCWIAAVGIGGIPDAGLISLSVVLATVGLPLEVLPLLLAVDWILSRARAMTNVLCDLTGSIALDRWPAGGKA